MTSFEKIYEIVQQIPEGKVSTYGQVAKLSGNPRWSRVVRFALHANLVFGEIPICRIVEKQGFYGG